MGEIAEMMLDGTLDYETGEFNFDGADGPGFPMTRAEAASFDIDWRGPRIIRPRGRPLHGFWLHVARAVHAGFDTQAQIAHQLSVPAAEVARAVHPMVRRGHLHLAGGVLSLTKHTKRQMLEEAGR